MAGLWRYRKRNKRRFLPVCILTSALLAIGARAATLWAVYDQQEAVHIDPGEVEDATLLIGTHLIYLGALNEKLYEIASDSAVESAQTEVYYKSELGDGKWYSVSDASALADITVQGKPVSDGKIRDLWVTHHTRPDGKTYDLRTEKPVSIYEIISPYDLHKLPELQPLERQWEAGRDLGDFFELQVEDEATEGLDEKIRDLEAFKERLKKGELSDSQEKMLDQCMGRVDALRRYQVYTQVRKASGFWMQGSMRAAKYGSAGVRPLRVRWETSGRGIGSLLCVGKRKFTFLIRWKEEAAEILRRLRRPGDDF